MGYGDIIDQGVGGVANIAGSFFSGSAAKQAQQAKITAINSLQGNNLNDLQNTATQYDTSSYLGRLGLLQKGDPNAYAAYMGAGQLANNAVNDVGGNRAMAQNAANAAYNENIQQNPDLAATQQQAASQANSLLAQGGSLSPEMQAELVRSGFAAGAGTGGVAGGTAQQSGLARQLATDQLNIQNQRQQMASGLVNTSQGIANNRANLLSNIGQQQLTQQNNALNVAGAANSLGSSRMPSSYGLTGSEGVDLTQQNTNLYNQQQLAKAGAQVEGINGQLAATNQLIGGVGNTASSAGKAVASIWTGGIGQ